MSAGHALSADQYRDLQILDGTPTVSLRTDLYPDLIAAGLVERFQVLTTALHRYKVTEKGRAALRVGLGEGSK